MLKRFGSFFLFGILCLSTAMHCEKKPSVEELKGLGNTSIQASFHPDKQIYAVGDTISVSGTIRPNDLKMSDFSTAEHLVAGDYRLYQENGEDIAYEAFSAIFDEKHNGGGFNGDKSEYRFVSSLKLIEPGRYRVQIGKELLRGRNDGEVFYSTLYISVRSGVQDPREYSTMIPIYFTNNGKTYFEIEVVD